MKTLLPVAMAALLSWPALAQTEVGFAGQWEGAISAPGHELKIIVDLAQNEKQVWTGTISIPEQNLKGFPLSDVSIAGAAAKFAMRGIPGNPAFDGKLASGGKSISGDFSQGGQTMPFHLTRAGEAKFEKSTPIQKEIEGTWEGTLDANGTMLRLVLKLANQAGGTATGTLVSVDQGGVEIPIAVVSQAGSSLNLLLPAIAGSYAGEVNKRATEITGRWTQGPNTFPLAFKRPAPAK
jgi:hypothetical protein